MFKIAVLEYGVSYDRFREDFINSHTFHDDEDADSRNDHLVNLGRIGSLLSLREDLVRTYSSKGTDRGSFFTCMEEFMLEKDLRIRTRFTNFECHLTARVLKVMTEAVNDIPLFKRNLTVNEIDALFNDCETPSDGPLVANLLHAPLPLGDFGHVPVRDLGPASSAEFLRTEVPHQERPFHRAQPLRDRRLPHQGED